MEIKVLSKALGILEFIASRRGVPTLAPELLRSMPDLTQPTCVRLLKTLCKAGYLEQLSRQKGYVLGPLAYYLGNASSYREELVSVARPVLVEFAAKYGQSILLTVRHGDFRTIPFGINTPTGIKLDLSRARYCDLTLSSTGRLLLSMMSEKEQQSFFVRHGFPQGDCWPENVSIKDVLSILQKIKNQGTLVSYHSGRGAGAVPVKVDGRVEAALGCVWSDVHKLRENEFMAGLTLAAKTISDTLSQGVTIG